MQAAAVEAYGRMIHDCTGKTIIFASLVASKLLHAPLTHMPATQHYHIVVCHQHDQPSCFTCSSIDGYLLLSLSPQLVEETDAFDIVHSIRHDFPVPSFQRCRDPIPR